MGGRKFLRKFCVLTSQIFITELFFQMFSKRVKAERPKRKFKRSFKKTRKITRKTPKENYSQSVVRVPGPVPDQMWVQLTYTAIFQYQPAAGTSQNTFRANSIFDPDFTGVGAQPRYYDQWATMYTSYQVFACKAENTITTATAVPVHCALGWFDVDPTALNITDVAESKFGRYLGGIAGSTGGPSSNTFTSYMPMNKLHGHKSIDEIDTLQAAFGANPADPAFFKMCCASVDGATQANCWIRTTLTYYVKMFSPVNVAQS